VRHHVIGQALTDKRPVRRRLRRHPAVAADEQRLLTYHGSRDDRAPHPVPILEANCARRADLRTGPAANAQIRRPREVKVGQPAGRRVGHAQRLDTHLAAGGHAQAAAEAEIATQAAPGLIVRHRVRQALLDLDVVSRADSLFDSSLGHRGATKPTAGLSRNVQRIHFGAAQGFACGGVHGISLQPGIDGGSSDLSGADRLHGRSRTMLPIAAREDARHVGHLGLRVGNNEAAHVLDPAAIEARQVCALADCKNYVIGFELQQAIGIELRVEATGLVLDPFAELEDRFAVLLDSYRTPARV
jgi:hypothetical protein